MFSLLIFIFVYLTVTPAWNLELSLQKLGAVKFPPRILMSHQNSNESDKKDYLAFNFLHLLVVRQ